MEGGAPCRDGSITTKMRCPRHIRLSPDTDRIADVVRGLSSHQADGGGAVLFPGDIYPADRDAALYHKVFNTNFLGKGASWLFGPCGHADSGLPSPPCSLRWRDYSRRANDGGAVVIPNP